MTENLLSDNALERSDVVANCRMNRERGLVGRNSYTAELGMNPAARLRQLLQQQHHVAWLDVCCGSGRALLDAARDLAGPEEDRVQLVGIDLVDHFVGSHPKVRLVTASIHEWIPQKPFDLITCVHGLHYLGDKLGVLSRLLSWLQPGGEFLAHLDLANLAWTDGRRRGHVFGKLWKQAGGRYCRHRRLLSCSAPCSLDLPWRYAGANDCTGPNFTGQPAVTSYYDPTKSHAMDAPGCNV